MELNERGRCVIHGVVGRFLTSSRLGAALPGPPVSEFGRRDHGGGVQSPVESLALTVDEVINVRRVLVKAEMEKFLQSKELYNNLKKGKVCCCCRVKFPIFSWPSTCLLCKRSVCNSCSAKFFFFFFFFFFVLQMKIPSKKMAHIPVYTVGFHSTPKSHGHKSNVYKSLRSLTRRSVEEEFPHLYAHGCTLRDICANAPNSSPTSFPPAAGASTSSTTLPRGRPKLLPPPPPLLLRDRNCNVSPTSRLKPTLRVTLHLTHSHSVPQLPPQPHVQQQRLQAPLSSRSPQLHAKTIANVNQ
ncbi:Protein spire-like protein 2 [Larimichthys crocea]|uniref:Protein spire-like protein 2 n=1 Tax=Larimichthys crocea TaxID=215358 RepID=A0A6G0IX08_LARCR|nr:Protein spire-like protein 2 [Larimichthys crocea]